MKTFLKEFKDFALKGNVLDMAVGIIIGGAFTAIVNSLVADILNPLLGLFVGNNFASLTATIGSVKFTYGNFIMAVINFLLVALVLFLIIRSINRMKDARYPCNEVFVWLGGKRSGVYGIEACPAELEAFESEFEAKKPVMWLAQRTGSYCEAVRILCGESQMGEDAAREFRSLFPWKKIRNEK